MTTHDDDFGKRVGRYLDEGTGSMRAGTAYRLQLARQAALARLGEPERATVPTLAAAGAGGGHSDLGGGRGFWASGRLWLGIGLIALATGGYQGYEHWRAQQLKDVEETDAAILTSDLPIDAYLDRGFQNWLRHLDEE